MLFHLYLCYCILHILLREATHFATCEFPTARSE
ncbi:hypothetical protein TcasGA2_TC033862 [Tribolium castaneum]|uniref:Uncharacterized protein n=1 Tax=Tribolium castaneum TaxID=7070 RepID=A0A139WF49_TRICA|nr:hypothetical protein TcasGA2_TC033862 [Tribolium castaneum]